MPLCKSCGYPAKDWNDLAQHIRDAKKGHAKGKKWAASVLLNVRKLDQKKDMPKRSTMTSEERVAVKEAKEETHRELSGESAYVMTVCPNCKKASRQVVPKEYMESPSAWRTGNGTLIIMCVNCRR